MRAGVALLLLLVGAAAVAADVLGAVVLRSHTVPYASLTAAQFAASSVSQQFTDLADRAVMTAVSFDVAGGTNTTLEALSFDFAVGRRVAGTTGAFAFAWNALELLPVPLVADVHIYNDFCDTLLVRTNCNASSPGQLLRTIRLDSVNNASSFYVFAANAYGTIYHADVLLLNRAGVFSALAADPRAAVRYWIAYVAHLPQQHRNGTASYEYTHRLPVGAGGSSQPALMLSDADHLLGAPLPASPATPTGWQDGNALAAAYYASAASPLPGFMLAGEVVSLAPAPTAAPSPLLPPAPRPAPAPLAAATPPRVLVVPAPRPPPLPAPPTPAAAASGASPAPTGTDPVTEAPAASSMVWDTLTTSVVVAGAILGTIIVGCLVVFVAVRVRRCRRRSGASNDYRPGGSPLDFIDNEFEVSPEDVEVPPGGANGDSEGALRPNAWVGGGGFVGDGGYRAAQPAEGPGALVKLASDVFDKATNWLRQVSGAETDRPLVGDSEMHSVDLDDEDSGSNHEPPGGFQLPRQPGQSSTSGRLSVVSVTPTGAHDD